MFREGEAGVREKRIPAVYACFVRASDIDDETLRNLKKWNKLKGVTREGSWWRLEWKNYKSRRKYCGEDGPFASKNIEVFEADVSPVRRFLTDYRVTIARPRRGYIDLETDPRNSIEKTIQGRSRILCWTIVREDGTAVAGVLEADTDEAEIEMLKDFWVELLEFEQVIAWGGDHFDFEVLKERSIRLGLRVNRKQWLWLDHLDVFRRGNMSASESGDEKQSMSLDNVSHAVLGAGKADIQISRGYEMWAAGGEERAKLVRYMVRDAHLMWRIEKKTGYIDLHQTVCEICSTLPDSRGGNPTNFVEGYLLRLGRRRDVRFKSRFGDARDGTTPYEGAYVMEPTQTGLLTGIHVCDFASLYPSIIITFNISPETYCPNIVLVEDESSRPSYLRGQPLKKRPIPEHHCAAGDDTVFRSDRPGMLPAALDELMRWRAEWKAKKNAEPPGTTAWKDADRRSNACKIAANSFYGVMGSPFSRFYETAVAGAVTRTGQWLLKETISEAEDLRYTGIYGDTDSVFIGDVSRAAFSDFVDHCNDNLYPKLLASKKAPNNRIKLSYEKEFSRLALVGKKRYAGRYAHYEGTDATADSKPEIKGLEYKRGDTLKLTRQMQHELIEMLLYREVEDIQSYVDWVLTWKRRITEDVLDTADITMTKKLSKHIDEYKQREKKDGGLTSRPAHVELAVQKNEQGADIRPGDRIPYIIADASVSPMKVVHLDDFTGDYDQHYIWENLVYPASQRVLESCFPEVKWKEHLRSRPRKVRAKKAVAETVPRGTAKKRKINVTHTLSLPGID